MMLAACRSSDGDSGELLSDMLDLDEIRYGLVVDLLARLSQ